MVCGITDIDGVDNIGSSNKNLLNIKKLKNLAKSKK